MVAKSAHEPPMEALARSQGFVTLSVLGEKSNFPEAGAISPGRSQAAKERSEPAVARATATQMEKGYIMTHDRTDKTTRTQNQDMQTTHANTHVTSN